ncbi:MAG: hypothetical protein LUC48_10635 [Clostridiales bacterium]|nr:hypothetical protein [Clostridiales bacterium]
MGKGNKSKLHKNGRTIHLTLHNIYILCNCLIAIFLESLIIFDVKTKWFIVSENSLYYVFSTSATTVATLYGLTLTGYIFFSDRLQNTIGKDDSMYDPVELLKRRYNRMTVFVTVTASITIFMCVFILLYGSENQVFPEWIYRLILDETLLMIFLSLASIIYFILNVADPDKIQRICDRQKIQMDKGYSDDTIGDFNEFVSYYDEIEKMIMTAFKDATVYTRKHFNTLNYLKDKKPLALASADALKSMDIISDTIWEQVGIVREYRNYVIHSSKQTVSRQMCDFARCVRDDLSEKLNEKNTDEQVGSPMNRNNQTVKKDS